MKKTKIGIITLSRIEINQMAFYNFQDIGLARAFAEEGYEVILYRLTRDISREVKQDGVRIIFKKVFGMGKQSITGFSFIDSEIGRLICFSDNQVSFPLLYGWCKQNNVLLQPYIGVLYSNSSSGIRAMIVNSFTHWNIMIYRNLKVYGKTPGIIQQFEENGIKRSALVPVCLNDKLLYPAEEVNINQIKFEIGFDENSIILLFVGRMEAEKEPLEMIEIYQELFKENSKCKLIMVGNGILYDEVQNKIAEAELENQVRLIKQVPNQDMWKLYCISHCLINLNRHEIYGMSILEAMYYHCPVIAMHAPGPDYIIENRVSGYLCCNTEEMYNYLLDVIEKGAVLVDTKKIIETEFLWKKRINLFLADSK